MPIKTVRLRFNNSLGLEDKLSQAIEAAEAEVNENGHVVTDRQIVVVPAGENGNKFYYTMWTEPIRVEPIGPMTFQTGLTKKL